MQTKAQIRGIRKYKHSPKGRANSLKNERSEKGKATKQRYFNSDKGRNRYYLRIFGITLEKYNELLKQQGGVCAICREVDSSGIKLGVDHCHRTKKVRGLLCRGCNTAIGLLKDERILLESAINYLKENETQN